MPIIHIYCKNCGTYLGQKSEPTFGFSNMESQTDYDPDCKSCNKYYDVIHCGMKRVNNLGICVICGGDAVG